jgi:hypothetical protein
MSLVLDGEVGDASPRIELIGRDERACRAHVEAALAGAAMILFRLIWSDFGGGKDRAEEQP